MAFNIMDLVKDQLTPKNISAIASMLGEDDKKASSGLAAIVPALLGMLIKLFSKPEGHDTFKEAMSQTDSGFLSDLAGSLSGSGGKSLVSSGLKMASSLFGDSKLGSLSNAISSISGLSSGSSKSLLGVAAPMLLGMLKNKQKSDGLDSGGLMDMLMGQKDNVAEAIPKDLSSALSGSGLLDDLMGKTEAGVHDVKAAAESAARATAGAAQHAGKESKSMFSRLLPVLILVLIGWFALQFLFKSKPAEETMKQVGNAAMETLMVDNVDLGKEVTTIFENTTKVLTGITDLESAKNAVTNLGDITQSLDKISNLTGSLPAEGRQMLADVIGKLLPGLDTAIQTAYAIPGVQDLIGNTVDNMMQKLTALSKA